MLFKYLFKKFTNGANQWIKNTSSPCIEPNAYISGCVNNITFKYDISWCIKISVKICSYLHPNKKRLGLKKCFVLKVQ